MTLSIIAKGAIAPVNAPVFGNLVHTDNMLFAMRASSSSNAFDLSDNEQSILLNNPENITYSQNGVLYPRQSYGTVDSINLTALNSYTLSAVITEATFTGGSIALGNWNSASNLAKTFLSLRKDSNTKISLIASFAATNVAGTSQNSYEQIYDITDQFTISNGVATLNKPIYTAAVICNGTSADSSYVKLFLSSFQAAAVVTNQYTNNSSNTYQFDAAKKTAVMSATPLCIGDVPIANGLWTEDTAEKVRIKEVRVDNTYLTDAQIEDQYQATKKWLIAEGAVDVSSWR